MAMKFMEKRVQMYTTTDRRAKPRIECDYPAIVEGMNGDGKKFHDHAQLVNLSASGLFMLVDRDLYNGSRLTVTIHLDTSTMNPETPKLATNGIVVRSGPHISGMCGVAVKFQNYRFL
jgi:hypothetical protein